MSDSPYSPYAPPQPKRGMGYSEHGDFRPADWTTTGTTIGIVASVVLGLVVSVMTSVVPEAARMANTTLLLAIGLLTIVLQIVSLATGVFFLIWMHRACANAHTFGHEGLDFTPGWCVGWWFIPIANLWKPYQAMREIWRASDPEIVGKGSSMAWLGAPIPSVFPLWWLSYQISGFIGLASGGLSALATLDNHHAPLAATVLLIVSQLFSIGSAIAIVSIMRQLVQRQETCFLQLSAANG